MAASNILVADKFQHKEVSHESQWANVKDYRFKPNDTIYLYRLQQSATGTLVWNWDEARTL